MTNNSERISAKLFSSSKPKQVILDRFSAFITHKYARPVSLEWCEDSSLGNGFRLEVGRHIYDWTKDGLLNQLDLYLNKIKSESNASVIPLLTDTLKGWTPKVIAEEIGVVESISDGIALVSGLENATYGEILLFDGGIRGMVEELNKKYAGCILFGNSEDIIQGSRVRRTGKTAGMPVGDKFIGRVIDALGSPIDGNGEIEFEEYKPIESPAPGIIERQSVNEPLETGLLAIDSMFPIGRGQRELIIGDRQTGKTSIAVDTIINQKGKDVLCVYVAIGQKVSSVSQLVNKLTENGAMDYTVVINASAADPASLQYIAPYSGCTLAEYYMKKGKDVLIIYDDLSKHAVAYRTLSLLLERSPGREAYPGDIFYLHSRLLERAAHLSDKLGGGSMTALPIVETQAGDVSAYIPTNIISITDGQIFLETNLFHSGQRPAVNVGLSVSRVGSAAQSMALKSAVGTLRLDLSQYNEMKMFTEFSSELDENTKARLNYGNGLMSLLKQQRYSPLSDFEQTVLLVAASNRDLVDISPNEISRFKNGFLNFIEENSPEFKNKFNPNEKITQEIKDEIHLLAEKYKSEFFEAQNG